MWVEILASVLARAVGTECLIANFIPHSVPTAYGLYTSKKKQFIEPQQAQKATKGGL